MIVVSLRMLICSRFFFFFAADHGFLLANSIRRSMNVSTLLPRVVITHKNCKYTDDVPRLTLLVPA